MGTIAVTGSASGIGAACTRVLQESGHRVIGVDQRDAEVQADLGTPAGRDHAVAAVAEAAGDALDGLVTCAGMGPLASHPPAQIVSVNYFGTVGLLEGLRPMLARGSEPSAVAISSNSATLQPGLPEGAVNACLAGDEEAARAAAEAAGWITAYPISKLGIARWVRREATGENWAGSGIRLNAVAPGIIETPLVAEGRADPQMGPLLKGFPVPIGHTGRPEDIASLVAYLLGPESSYFCGSVVFCDGGTDALMRSDDWPSGWSTPAS